jgi:glycerol-3-phosphate acyltransferase PlsY
VTHALALVIGYLLGSIPSGFLAARLRGIDIRTVGSGSMGTTNVFRTVGGKLGSLVMAADILKGLAAVLIGTAVGGTVWGILAGAAAMAGHVWPVWLGFKGGKGVATGMGVLLGVAPVAVLAAVPVWVAIALSTRLVSVASITSVVLLPALAFTFGADPAAVAFTILGGLVVIALHHGNIRRLARGEELAISLPRRRGGRA